MTAKSDPDEYGKLQAFVMPRGVQIDGPALVNARILSTSAISREISLLNTEGSRVQQGNVLVIPIENSLLYIRPLYVESNDLPELRKVIVVYGRRAIMGDSLEQALAGLFGASSTGGIPPSTPPPSGGEATPSPTVKSLLDEAARAFDAAEAALRNGDLAGYQLKVREAQSLVRQAAEANNSATATTTTTQPPASA
jgi:uncharacterized membrane protein (UPF0182 family)